MLPRRAAVIFLFYFPVRFERLQSETWNNVLGCEYRSKFTRSRHIKRNHPVTTVWRLFLIYWYYFVCCMIFIYDEYLKLPIVIFMLLNCIYLKCNSLMIYLWNHCFTFTYLYMNNCPNILINLSLLIFLVNNVTVQPGRHNM